MKLFRKKKINNFYINGSGSVTPEFLSINEKYDYYKLYETTPELNTVINYLSKLFSNIKIKVTDNDGDEVENSLTEKLFNPNPLQSQKEFIIQLYIYWQVFGYANIFVDTPDGFDLDNYDSIQSIWNVPIQHTEYKAASLPYGKEYIDEIIYKVWQNTREQYSYPVEKIIWVNDSTICFENGNYLIGTSKIKSLLQPITNLRANYEARNVILKKRGAIGILSNDSKDATGHLPMNEQEINDLQDRFFKYGLTRDQFQVIISNANLRWQNIGWSVKDLMLDELLIRDKIAICDAYQLPILLLNEMGGSTYSNLAEAQKIVYQNKIIPDWKQLEIILNNAFKTKENNLNIKLDYSSIEVLQKNAVDEANIKEKNVKLIIDLNKSIYNNEMTKETAVNVLINMCNITYDTASEMLIDTPINMNNNE